MSEIVQMIATYGVFPVLLGAVIVVGIFMIKSQHSFNKKQQEINEKQAQDNIEREERFFKMYNEMMSTMTEIHYQTTTVHSKEEEEENRRVDEAILQLLQRLLDKSQANRASCFLYHNGGRNVLGRSFQKLSMTHEIVDCNTVPVMQLYQQMPRMMFPILNEKMAEQGFYYIEDISEIQAVDTVTYQSFIARGVKAAFIQAIKATSGVVLGFITLEFTSSSMKETKEIRHCLRDKAIKISGMLEVTDEAVNKKRGE